MSLRLRLLGGLTALVLAALAALAVGTEVAVRHNLMSRLDGQLSTASPRSAPHRHPTAGPHGSPDAPAAPAGSGAPGGDGGGASRGGGGADGVPPQGPVAEVRAAVGPDDYVEYLGDGGAVLSAVGPTVSGGAGRPVLDTAALGASAGTRLLDARTATGSVERVSATTLADGSGVVVAGSLRSVDAAVTHLVEAEAGVGAVVLVVTLALGLVLARAVTRPLEQIAHTADAIAGGDLDPAGARRCRPQRGRPGGRRLQRHARAASPPPSPGVTPPKPTCAASSPTRPTSWPPR